MSDFATLSRDELRAAMTRSMEREGIPMVVALTDERGPMPTVDSRDVLEDGAALADRMLQIRLDLAPTMRDGDNAGVLLALVGTAHEMTSMDAAHG